MASVWQWMLSTVRCMYCIILPAWFQHFSIRCIHTYTLIWYIYVRSIGGENWALILTSWNKIKQGNMQHHTLTCSICVLYRYMYYAVICTWSIMDNMSKDVLHSMHLYALIWSCKIIIEINFYIMSRSFGMPHPARYEDGLPISRLPCPARSTTVWHIWTGIMAGSGSTGWSTRHLHFTLHAPCIHHTQIHTSYILYTHTHTHARTTPPHMRVCTDQQRVAYLYLPT